MRRRWAAFLAFLAFAAPEARTDAVADFYKDKRRAIPFDRNPL